MSDPTDPITRLNAALEGRYEIERELGEGGMAMVYLAEDLRHERKVALKVLKPELAAVVGAERFLAEIKTTANLQHPHILPLFDSGQAESFLYYVMPYVEGDTLRDKIDREKQLGIEEALDITKKVASALDYAHNHGVVHRDIKPGNILLSAEGEPTVADFGIALAVAHAGGGRVTETGLSVGTPHYMSPEQATGDRDVDPRTDVYALGSVLYEMLVGDPPYGGSTAQAVLAKILTDPAPAPTKVRLSIPLNVDAAIRKALEKLPADRFASAQDFSQALGDAGFRHGEEFAVGVAAARSLWNPLSVGLAVVALVFAATTTWVLLRLEPPQPVTRQVLSTEGWAGLQTQIGRRVALAPDGSSMILTVLSSPQVWQLALKMRGSTDLTPIPGTEFGQHVVYSPDSEWIAYSVGRDLIKRPLVGGSPVRLAEDLAAGTAGLAWLDDGTILYDQETELAGGAATVMRISEDGGEPIGVVLELAEVFYIDGLPGGRGAVVIGCSEPQCGGEYVNNLTAYITDIEGSSVGPALDRVVRAWYTPTGHLVYVRTDGAVFAAEFDLGSLDLGDSGIPLFAGVRFNAQGNVYADMQLAADGTLLYVEGSSAGTSTERQLVVVDLDGNRQPLALTPRNIPNLGVGWSPDGESVVFSSDGQIYTYNVTLGTTPRQLTFEGNNVFAVFSPDGTQVAFSSNREGTDSRDLFVKDLNDDSPPRSIITLDGDQDVMQWPSDTLIVFERSEGFAADLWTVNLSDPDNPIAEEYLSSEANLRRISVSPDGSLAAYWSNESGAGEIYIRSFPEPGGLTRVTQGGGGVPFWSPDGNTLYYAQAGRPMKAARLQRNPVPVVLSTDTLFSGTGAEPYPGSALHPDGDRFILARNVGDADTPAESDEPERLILVQNFFEELRQAVPER